MNTSKDFLDAKKIEIDGQQFIVSRLPAFDAAAIYDDIVQNKGIISQDDKLALASRCALVTDKGEIVLDMPVLINQYLKFPTFSKLVDEAFKANFTFSDSGSLSQE